MLVCEIHVYRADPVVVAVKRKSTGLLLWQVLLKHLQIQDYQYFGIQYRDVGNQKRWLDLRKSLSKQFKDGSDSDVFPVSLRVKLWPSDPSQVTDDLARCLMVAEVYEKMQNGSLLQYRRNSMILIGGLTLQSQLGDYHNYSQGSGYARRFFICLDQCPKLEAEMEAFHQSSECRGLEPSECDKQILLLVRQQPLYGIHQCNAMDGDGHQIDLGVCWRGLLVLKGYVVVNTFSWIRVKKSFVKKNVFFVEVISYNEIHQIGFCMESKSAAKCFRKLFIECQAFYTEAPRQLTRKASVATMTEERAEDRFSYRRFIRRRHSEVLPKQKELMSSLSSLSPVGSLASPYSGKFDLQLSLPCSTHTIRESSIRRRAVCGDKHLYEPPSPVSARKGGTSSIGKIISEKEELMSPEGPGLYPKDDQSIFTECDSLQGNDDDEGYSDCSLGVSTPDGVLIPDIDINQVVRRLSEEQKDTHMYPENFLACELRDTERSYCTDLQLLNEQFRSQLVKSQFLSPRQVSDLFGNLSLIQEFHKDLLAELEGRMAFCDSYPEQYNHRYQIGDILKDRMACVKLYTSYVKNESKIFELVSQWQRENSDFNRLCSQFECYEACHRPISELFFRPFQRVVHYREIIKRLHLHCLEKTECSDLKEALSHVENALEHMNESTRAAENTRKMIRIQREVIGVRNVLQPGRILVMEGSLLKMDGKGAQVNHFFLFNDILLYAVKRSGLNGMRLYAQGVLTLAGMTVEENNDSMSSSSALFKISTAETSFVVTAETVRDKNMWMDAMQQSIFACENSGTNPDVAISSIAAAGCDSLGAGAAVRSATKVKKCISCRKTFSLFRRRLKCERCCKVVCPKCLTVASHSETTDKTESVCLSCYSDSIRCDPFSSSEKRMSFVSVGKRGKRQSLLGQPKQWTLSKISSAAVLGIRSTQSVEVSSQVRQSAVRVLSGPLLLSLRSGSFLQDSEMSGYLFRRARRREGWKQFWVVVSHFSLQHYKKHDDCMPVSTLVPSDYELAFPDVNDVEVTGCMYVFKLSCGPRVLFYMTESKFALDRWTDSLSSCVKRSRVHRWLGHLSKHHSNDWRPRSNTVC